MGNPFYIDPNADYSSLYSGNSPTDTTYPPTPEGTTSLATQQPTSKKSLVRKVFGSSAATESGLTMDSQGKVVPVEGQSPKVPNLLRYTPWGYAIAQNAAKRDLQKKSLALDAAMVQQKMQLTNAQIEDAHNQSIDRRYEVVNLGSGKGAILVDKHMIGTPGYKPEIMGGKVMGPDSIQQIAESFRQKIGEETWGSSAFQTGMTAAIKKATAAQDETPVYDFFTGWANRQMIADQKQEPSNTQYLDFGGHKWLVDKAGNKIKDMGVSSSTFNITVPRPGQEDADIESAAQGLVQPGNLTTLRDISSLRGNQRLKIYARARELDPNFDPGVINQRAKFLQSYEDPKGRAAINRQSINNIIQHAADLSTVNKQYRRTNMRVVNTAVNAIANQFGDTAYTNFQVPLGVIKDELSLYFAGGYAPTVDQQKMWDKIQGDSATPAQIEAFAKDVIHVGLRRASTFNSMFRKNMGVDDPNMITPEAKVAAQELGVGGEVSRFGSGGELRTGLRSLAQPQATRPSPLVGTIRGGYKFKGGDPSDKNNWVKQ